MSPATLLIVSLCCGAITLAALAKGYAAAAGSTLAAPWYWSCIAVVVVTAAATYRANASADPGPAAAGLIAVSFLAAVATFMPTAAVLGAKRPQDRGWQFVVASLWAILFLPCGQWWLTGGGRSLTLHPAWSWFLAVLIAIQCGNYLACRYWPSSLLFAIAQVLLLWGNLPGTQAILSDAPPAADLRTASALDSRRLPLGWWRSVCRDRRQPTNL